jgi:hypothetical protein
MVYERVSSGSNFFFYQFIPSFSFLSSSSSLLFRSLPDDDIVAPDRPEQEIKDDRTTDAQHSVAAGRICLHQKSKQIFPFFFSSFSSLENQIILNCEAISKTDANQKSEILI